VTIVYLVPVLIAGTRWGPVPAVASAVGGVAASAFFFYPPLFDLRVSDPQQITDIALFVCVAVVTGRLADNARAHMSAAQKSEAEVRSLYKFSRRLAAASTVDEILAAARDHVSSTLGRRILLFHANTTAGEAALASGATWVKRPICESNPALGTVAIDLGHPPAHEVQSLHKQVDLALADVSATLERLDVARALEEARARSGREAFREAVIGSVSHELRTPLAGILGAASILSSTPFATQDKRLAALLDVIRSEAERLDGGIQKLLDASRVSSEGLRPQRTWTDPADLIDAALEPYRRAHAHRFQVLLSDELPLLHIDPILVQQAIGLIIDNALKYSPTASAIVIDAQDDGSRITLRVRDDGVGITAEERERLFERFYRSPRHQRSTAGSGLGLWIARAFIAANDGRLEIDCICPSAPVPQGKRGTPAHDQNGWPCPGRR
jgi:two-component system sensor histidine kinase KdpD